MPHTLIRCRSCGQVNRGDLHRAEGARCGKCKKKLLASSPKKKRKNGWAEAFLFGGLPSFLVYAAVIIKGPLFVIGAALVLAAAVLLYFEASNRLSGKQFPPRLPRRGDYFERLLLRAYRMLSYGTLWFLYLGVLCFDGADGVSSVFIWKYGWFIAAGIAVVDLIRGGPARAVRGVRAVVGMTMLLVAPTTIGVSLVAFVFAVPILAAVGVAFTLLWIVCDLLGALALAFEGRSEAATMKLAFAFTKFFTLGAGSELADGVLDGADVIDGGTVPDSGFGGIYAQEADGGFAQVDDSYGRPAAVDGDPRTEHYVEPYERNGETVRGHWKSKRDG